MGGGAMLFKEGRLLSGWMMWRNMTPFNVGFRNMETLYSWKKSIAGCHFQFAARNWVSIPTRRTGTGPGTVIEGKAEFTNRSPSLAFGDLFDLLNVQWQLSWTWTRVVIGCVIRIDLLVTPLLAFCLTNESNRVFNLDLRDSGSILVHGKIWIN